MRYYPYLRGVQDIYSCADEHRVGRRLPAGCLYGRGSALAAPAAQSPVAAGLRRVKQCI